MSTTIEIEPDDWSEFFDSFSRRHDGWLVTVELLAGTLGDQIEVENLPFRGITTDTREHRKLELRIADAAQRHLTHTIERPRRVWLKQSDDGADEVLEIEAEGAETLIHFRAAMPTEAVDGVAP